MVISRNSKGKGNSYRKDKNESLLDKSGNDSSNNSGCESENDTCKTISHALKKKKCVVVIERNDEVIKEAKRQKTKDTIRGNNILLHNPNNTNDSKNKHYIDRTYKKQKLKVKQKEKEMKVKVKEEEKSEEEEIDEDESTKISLSPSSRPLPPLPPLPPSP